MIYDLNYKEFTKLMNDFGKTVYGKAMFVICYTPFLLGFVLSVMTSLSFILDNCVLTIFSVAKIILGTIILLCIGSYGFYNELRKFAKCRNKKEE